MGNRKKHYGNKKQGEEMESEMLQSLLAEIGRVEGREREKGKNRRHFYRFFDVLPVAVQPQGSANEQTRKDRGRGRRARSRRRWRWRNGEERERKKKENVKYI